MDTIPFIIASKRVKYSGINLTKKAKDVYRHSLKITQVWFQTTAIKPEAA